MSRTGLQVRIFTQAEPQGRDLNPFLQALVYDILPSWRKVPESDARCVRLKCEL